MNIHVVHVHVTVVPLDNETTNSQQTKATYSNKVSVAFRLSNTQTQRHTDTHTHTHTRFAKASYAVCTSKPGNQKPFVFRGAVWRKRVGWFPVPTTPCSPGVLATASHPCLHQ